jgi:hypothetical protein
MTTTDTAVVAISMTRGKPRIAQINRQITATAPKTILSTFSVTDLKDIALSPLSDLANNALKNRYAVPSHR